MDVETMLIMRNARRHHHSGWKQYGAAVYAHNHPDLPAMAEAMKARLAK